MRTGHVFTALALAVAIVPSGGALHAGEPAAQTSGSQANASASAREAGARYGQALGALEICHSSKLTDKAKNLGDAFAGAEHEIFKSQAAKVFEAWHGVKNCKNQHDPNQCKIIMDKSCAIAEAEIGGTGTILPGLIDFMKR